MPKSDNTTDVTAENAAQPATTEATSTTSNASTGTDETVTLTKADHDAMQSQLAAFRRQQKKAEEQAAEAERKRLEDEGKHKEIADAEKARADKAEAALADHKREQRIERLATKMKFRDSRDALANLPEGLDRDDEAAVEAALTQVAKTKPYLIDTGTVTRTGGQAGGPADPATLDQQIAEAEAKGDFKTAGALKARKLIQSKKE